MAFVFVFQPPGTNMVRRLVRRLLAACCLLLLFVHMVLVVVQRWSYFFPIPWSKGGNEDDCIHVKRADVDSRVF